MVGRDKLTPLELEMRLKIADELNKLKEKKELSQNLKTVSIRFPLDVVG